MSEQENIKVVMGIVDMVLSNELHRTPEFFHEDYVGEVPGAAGITREQSQQWTQGFLDAFPDIKHEITRVVAQGDDVILMTIMTGTNTGPLPLPTGGTIPPTGRSLRTPTCYAYTLRDGKVIRAQAYMDGADLLGQLGLLPALEGAREVGG
jgi:predicted ester cyclase